MLFDTRPHRDDILIAVLGLTSGILLWSLGLHMQTARSTPDVWLALVPLTVMSALELLRRSHPQFALAAGTLALVGDQLTVGSLSTVAMFTDLVYAGVLYGTPAAARRIPVTTFLVSVGITIGLLAWFQQAEALLVGIVAGLVFFGSALTGAAVRNHRDAAEAARLRAEQTALLAEMDRAQAVTAERARMARELHDLVAGHLSAIAIHSTAALSLDDPGTTRGALGVIRENSVQGLAEMRRLIGLLRDSGGGDLEPSAAPTLAGLDALVEQSRTNAASTGLEFTLTGLRPEAGKLPAPVELAAYRIVQESLTNALKHAAPGEVRVRLERTGPRLRIEVTSPYGHRPGPRAPGSGAGLVGMRERVALLGGTLEAGPVAGGDTGEDGAAAPEIWRVRAELPVTEGDERT